jgi:hypothetical protein
MASTYTLPSCLTGNVVDDVRGVELRLERVGSFVYTVCTSDQVPLQGPCSILAHRAKDALAPGLMLRGIPATYAALGRLVQASINIRGSEASTAEASTNGLLDAAGSCEVSISRISMMMMI